MIFTRPSDPALRAMAQADVLRLLASLFRQPSEETAERLRFAVQLHDELLIDAGSRNKVAWCRHLTKAAQQLERPGINRVKASHDRLFDGPTHCPINESSYVGRDTTAILTDIHSFYRAFGFEAELVTGEKVDHLVSELEFMAMLLVMMGNALDQDRAEDAETCARALRLFAADHAAAWLPSFCDHLEQAADLPFHDSAAQLLRQAWARFCSRYEVKPTDTRHQVGRHEGPSQE